MNILPTQFSGLFILEPIAYTDARGYFFESYSQQKLLKAGIDIKFVQDNQSFSVRNVIRGLHYQAPPFAQTKLIQCLSGTILDVVVDLRRSESTFCKVFTIKLSSTDKKQLLIPKGFAHGFSVLSENATIMYKCDAYYNASSERGIQYNDPSLSIDWIVDKQAAIVSAKDLVLPPIGALTQFFE
ncbi:MAG TPA: dTDP-4-dehydrorhamnose 3,5-epimerase [Cyclobacteriaceae bacterium]|nr:dTDP-4-dehydrorhamnose 3,5-epimerase [Cyclobacteriaceae bacterium]